MHRNTVYGHPEWARHKSSWRHWPHMVSIFASGMIGGIGPPVLLSTLSAVFVTLVNLGVTRHKFPDWVPVLRISITPFTLVSPVLAFLLVFRTNSSYQRFDEARKAWGSNVNRCRDLARQALTWIRNREKLATILRFIKAYPFYLKHHLTDQATNSQCEFLENGILDQSEIDTIARAQNRPIYILQVR
jgi:putative membrane protein